MSKRAERRRRQRTQPPSPPSPGSGASRAILFGLGFLVLGILVVGAGYFAGTIIFDDDDSGRQVTTEGDPVSGGTVEDEEDIEALAKRSVDVLPDGEWPSLYDDFTAEFQARCPRQDFDRAGVETANNLGGSLQLLEFVEIKDMIIPGDFATGTIVGHYKGQAGSEYETKAAFQRVDGEWKLAPSENTTGCQAFNLLGED